MLAQSDRNGGWVQWVPGTRAGPGKGVWPPRDAETALSDAELATLGLYRVVQEEVPDGKRATAWALVDVDGLPVRRPTLADLPPPPTPEQLAAQFDSLVLSTDQTRLAIRAVVSLLADRMGVTDAQAKTAVKNRMQAIAEGTRG